MNHGEVPEIFRRSPANPILVPGDFGHRISAVFNPGATMYEARTLLLVRAEDHTGRSSLLVATSENGVSGWEIDQLRGIAPKTDTPEERWGVEDPRITKIGDEYYVVYIGYSANGPLVKLARTRDFTSWQDGGVLESPEDKDAALFPTTFGGKWALIHRPMPATANTPAHMWISESSDLINFGSPKVMLGAGTGGQWDAHKIGLGPPPLLTRDGWLICYHGVRETASGALYRLGLAMMDRDDPTKVLARSPEWVFGARDLYERVGDVPGVVFSCGWVLRDDGDTLDMYYGGADSVIGLAKGSLSQILNYLGDFPVVERRRN